MISKDGINEVQSCPGPHFHKRPVTNDRESRQLSVSDRRPGLRREQKVLRLYDYKIFQPYFAPSIRKYNSLLIWLRYTIISLRHLGMDQAS